MSIHWTKDVDKLCKDIKDEYHYLEERLNTYKEQLQSWNKDVEIEKANKRADDYVKHSLLQLTDKELTAQCLFVKNHIHEHNSTFIYELTGTGLGTGIKIKCPVCGAEEDITDIDSW